jgi:plastocyanin
MNRLLLAGATALASLCVAGPAGAVVYVDGTGEPAFTNTTTNTQFVKWQGSSAYDAYRIEFNMFEGTNLVHTQVGGYESPNGAGTKAISWGGIRNPLQEGTTYTICGFGRYWIGGVGSTDSSSCYDAGQTGKNAATTIDLTPPSIAVKIDNGAAYSRTAKLNYHIDYSDNLAFPFPSNWICRDVGGDPASACSNVTHEYNEACSVPLGGMKKVTYFNCDEDLSVHNIADGPVTFCAVAADGAIPDNPNGPNQGARADQANRSGRVCDSIIVDRTPPQATISPSATTVLTGDLVTFTAQASDAGSGLAGSFAWTWGDNTADGTGASASHSFTTAGTYEVKLTTKDAAGNETTATKVITVTPRPATGTGGGTPTGGGTGTGGKPATGGTTGGSGSGTAGGAGAVTAPPTVKEIVASAGGGGTQETTVAGLEVLAPKRLKLTAKTKALSIALTAEAPGQAAIALVRGGRVHAQGTAAIAAAGTLGYRLKLPRKLKAGAYRLKISFTPQGAAKATTKTVKLTVVAARKATAKKASAARATRVGAGPVGRPSGTAPKAPKSRRVALPLR